MKKQRKQPDQQRRNFLRSSIATGASAVIAAAVPAVAIAETTENSLDGADKPGKRTAGYQLSQHVIDYYKTCAR